MVRDTKARTGRGGQSGIALGIAALGASVWAAWSAGVFWGGMPIGQVGRLTQAEYEGIYERYHGGIAGEERDAYAMKYAGDTFCKALTGDVTAEEAASSLATAVSAGSRMPLGRLYLAGIKLLQMEQAGRPVEEWWASVRGYLAGLEHGDLSHKQRLLVQRWARAYESVAIAEGTAYGLAIDAVGHPHGPFLEYITRRLGRLIEEREAAGDAEAAATCRAIRLGLLERWTLESGAIDLRLHAALYLAEAAAARETGEAVGLWRDKFLLTLRKRPVSVLDPHNKPVLCPEVHARLLRRATLVYWLCAGAGAAALATLGAFWLGLNADKSVVLKALPAFAIGAVIVIAGGLMWTNWCEDLMREDYRRVFSGTWCWPTGATAAGLLALTVIGVSVLLRRWTRSVKSTAAAQAWATAAGVWLVLAISAAVCAMAGVRVQANYETLTRAALERPTVAVLGDEGEQGLDALRCRRD